jgi:hypothetical protein
MIVEHLRPVTIRKLQGRYALFDSAHPGHSRSGVYLSDYTRYLRSPYQGLTSWKFSPSGMLLSHCL